MKKTIVFLLLATCSLSNAQTNYFDGTSIAKGEMVSTSQRYSTLFDKNSVNTATSGSCMEDRSPKYAKSGFSKIASLPKYSGGYYFIEYYGNDVLFNSPYSTAGFMKAYNAYIAKLLALGWPRNKIIVFYNYFIPSKGVAYYNKLFGTQIPDANRINRYNEALMAVIKNNKVDSFDIGNAIFNVPTADATKLFASDNLHLAALGHWYIAQALIAKFKVKEPPVVQLFDSVRVEYWLPIKTTHDTLVLKDSIKLVPRMAKTISIGYGLQTITTGNKNTAIGVPAVNWFSQK